MTLLRHLFSRKRPVIRRKRGPLKVQFVITSMPVGGAETLLVNLLDRLDQSRLQAEVICLKEPGPLGQQIAGRIPVHSGLIGNKWDVRVLWRLVRLLRKQQTDAVITVGAGDKMFWGRLAACLAGVPVICSALHSTGWPDGVGRLNRGLTPLTDAFIAVADSHGEFMRLRERFPADKVHVIRNGIDTTRFDCAAVFQEPSVRDELGLPADAPLVGIVAALRPEKNHAMFVDVAASVLLEEPDSHFLVIGDGPERETIIRRCEGCGIADRVHLLGTRQDTARLLSALDVFLLTSHNEASPVSILEALACKVPVVSTNVGSIAETVIPEQTGYLVAVDDVSTATALVTKLLRDENHSQTLGDQGRRLVVAQGSLDSMVEGYQSLIEGIYDQRAAGKKAARPQKVLGSFVHQTPR